MATLKLILDKRKGDNKLIDLASGLDNNRYPLVLRVFHKKLYRDIGMNYNFRISEWIENDKQLYKTYPNSGRINSSISKRYAIATTVLADYAHLIADKDIDSVRAFIKDEIELQINPPTTTAVETLMKSSSFSPEEQNLFLGKFGQILKDRLDKKKKFKTSKWYDDSIAAIKKFNSGNDIRLIDITVGFLKDFEADFIGRGGQLNGLSAYLRAIRSITNQAIKEVLNGVEFKTYPWGKKGYTIVEEKTRKRAVDKVVIAGIREVSVSKIKTPALWNAKNYLLFMFNCRGMNFIDIAKLKAGQIINRMLIGDKLVGGRLEYVRSKNGRSFSMKLTKEAIAVLNDYDLVSKGADECVFPIGFEETKGGRLRYEYTLKNNNRKFNKLAKDAGHVDVDFSSYVIRHTWASTARRSGVSIEVIGEGLGHDDPRVTKIYVEEYDTDVLDDANDRIVA